MSATAALAIALRNPPAKRRPDRKLQLTHDRLRAEVEAALAKVKSP